MKSHKTKKVIGLLIFIIGLGLILYPIISRTYYDFYYRQEVNRMNEGISDARDSEYLYEKQFSYNNEMMTNVNGIQLADVGFAEEEEAERTVDFTNKDVLGTLSISAIDLNYPIYDGATDENLYNGVARIEGTSYPVGGINTNSVIAGHNGLVGKTYFSDIKKLVSGDIIEIQNRKELISYKVYDTAVIEPTDISALALIPGQDTLTLLTCTSPPPGTHRYLVYASRVPNIEDGDSRKLVVASAQSQEASEDSRLFEESRLFVERYAFLLLLLLAGLVLAYFIFIREESGD